MIKPDKETERNSMCLWPVESTELNRRDAKIAEILFWLSFSAFIASLRFIALFGHSTGGLNY